MEVYLTAATHAIDIAAPCTRLTISLLNQLFLVRLYDSTPFVLAAVHSLFVMVPQTSTDFVVLSRRRRV